jgi:AcrR family transcriptional regulator
VARHTPVARRLGRPPDVDSAETRARLLEVARRLFATKGYDATTNRDLADAAGLTSGAIYHYFGSKTELYVAVYAEVQLLVYSRFDDAIATEQTLLGQFSAVLDAAVALNREDSSLAGFVVGVAGEAQRHPDLAQPLRPLSRRGSQFLHRMVVDAVERGEIDQRDLAAVEDLLNSVLSGLARFSTLIGDSGRHAAAVDALKRFFAGSLLRR